MREFGVEKSWTQFVKVANEPLRVGVTADESLFFFQPLCISENGDVLVLLMNRSEIILYSRTDNKVLLREIDIEVHIVDPDTASEKTDQHVLIPLVVGMSQIETVENLHWEF
ncbi:hypothetical protein RIF29_41610 [Crotalaria pallida]|uniref:Uncharacterized protein n=1 Tax=Crotalaria pallida TaxID=3830 RepID=A0AAN9E5X5_CROPI